MQKIRIGGTKNNNKNKKNKSGKIPKIVAYGAFDETVCTAPLGPMSFNLNRKQLRQLKEQKKRGEKYPKGYNLLPFQAFLSRVNGPHQNNNHPLLQDR